jgi:hypothetical protein
MWKLGDTVIREGKSWKDSNGVTHPQTWARWTDDEKKAAGLTFVADPKTWDNRFYWGWNADETSLIERNIADVNEVDDDGNPILDEKGNQVITRGLKYAAIRRCKETARSRLQSSDWLITRQAETGKQVSSTILDYRAAVRTASGIIEDKINACDTLAKFMALYDVPVDKDNNVTGNAPIHDWPEEL